ncbi:MAG: (4Fe-4S)-binding protein [Bacteroidia bacterium]|nr:(4Fe-4S)-binding protein [Bacteroidia bacterium]
MENPNNRDYKNEEITVFWRPDLCIHSTICWRHLVEVFNPKKRPWVKMDGAETDRIIETVKMCPSTALSFKWNDESRNRESQPVNVGKARPDADIQAVKIIMKANGPLEIKGKVSIFDPDGNQVASRPATFLCRCGASGQMPYCDGSHLKIKFKG